MKIARNKSWKKRPLARPLLTTRISSGTDRRCSKSPSGDGYGAAGKRKKRAKHGRVDVSCRIFSRRARVIIKLKPRALYMYKTEAAHFSDRCTFESSL